MEDRPARLDVWDLQRTIDQGQSRAKVIATLQEGSLQQAQGSIDGSQRSLLLAQMWTEMGIHEAAAASTKDASRHLSFALQRSWQLAEAGDYDSAILLLLNHELIDHLNFPSYQRWYPGIWRIVYLQARRVGRFKAMSSICRAYPDAARDVDGQQSVDIRDKAGAARDEAMHGRRVLSTFKEELLGQLRSATEGFGRVGQRRRAIAIVEEVEKRAERAQLFEVHRMARVARAQLLLSACQDCVEDEDDGTADEIADYEEMDGAVGGAAESREEEAREIMESILPQCLMDVNVERRGQAEWVYAQSILAQTRRRARREAATEEKTREDLQEGMRWLQKSDEGEEDFLSEAVEHHFGACLAYFVSALPLYLPWCFRFRKGWDATSTGRGTQCHRSIAQIALGTAHIRPAGRRRGKATRRGRIACRRGGKCSVL